MYMVKVLTAYRGDIETWRIERLARVAERFKRHQERKKRDVGILALHDHKGVLFVNWASNPETQDIAAMFRVWRRENEYACNHYVGGDELLIDVPSGYSPFKDEVIAA
jgi:hypothetical protein